ncbi:MAG: SBBP repeat-containing protein [Hymenobacteraceae bacterium]|nr:SBBP repeat-containing protein [Hymenobacteraceae bacterium]
MKNVLLEVVKLLLRAAGRVAAQAPGWAWATAPGAGVGFSSAVDAAGNVYVTGYFAGTATFGTTTLTSAGQGDGFVAKLTRSGTYQWVAQVAGAAYDIGNTITVGAAGDVYVTGYFESQLASFGPTISLTNTSAGGATGSDAFIAKLNAAGVWQWAVKGGGSRDDYGSAVTVDGSGNAYVTGEFRSPTATFGPAAGNPITLTNSTIGGGTPSTFVAKLNAAGVYQWATGTTGFSGGTSVVVDGNGQVYVGGFYQDAPITFGSIVLPQPSLPPGATDVYIARLTAAGAWDWAIAATSTSGVIVGGMALDRSGNLLISGGFVGQLTIGAITLTGDAGQEMFAAKLNPAGAGAGACTWAVRAGGNGQDTGSGLTLDGSGNVYVTGVFSGLAFFGPTTLSSAGSGDVFVAKITPDGTWQWVIPAGGATDDGGLGVAVQGNETMCVTGYFASYPANFGSISLPSNLGDRSIFIAHIGATGVGLPEGGTTPPFTLAPNPAHHTATLTGASGSTATLLDGLGRTVRTVPLSQGAATLDLRGLPAGLYVVRAGETTRRLVVE